MAKQKVQDVSVPTDESGWDLKIPDPKEWHGTDQEKARVGHVNARWREMWFKRVNLDRDWKVFEVQRAAEFVPYPDERSASTVPLMRAIEDLAVAELKKRAPEFNFEWKHGFELQGKTNELVWKDDWARNNRTEEIELNDRTACQFGTAAFFNGFEMENRVIHDLDEDFDDEPTYTRKLETKGKILLQNFDIRRVWFDEQATSMEGAVDCVAEQLISYGDFYKFKLDKSSGWKNLDAVGAGQTWSTDYLPYYTREERGNSSNKYVKLTHYWNKVSDDYFVVANNKVLVREGHILNARHQLPFTLRQWFRNPNSLYGTGMNQILLQFQSDINTFREMYMDAVKRSNSQVIAIGGGLSFDGRQFSYNNQILQFKGNMGNGNFQQLSGNPPNAALNDFLEKLYTDVAIYGGVDLRNIMGISAQTAYQTAVQKESQLQRMNTIITTRDAALQRVANMHLDNIQMYYPRKMVRELVPVDDNLEPTEDVEKTYPTVEAKGMKIKKDKYITTEETSLIEVTPEVIRGQVGVKVYTNLNAPTINEVEKEQLLGFYNTGLTGIANAYMANPEMETIKPKADAIRELARKFNVQTGQSDVSKAKEMKKKLYADMEALLAQTKMPEPAMGTEQPGTETGIPSANLAQAKPSNASAPGFKPVAPPM